MSYDLFLESVNPKYRAAAIQAAYMLGYARQQPMGEGTIFRTESAHGLDLRGMVMHMDTAPCRLFTGLSLEDAERFKREMERGRENSEYPLPGPDETACVVTIRESEG